jgi:rubrerythrin
MGNIFAGSEIVEIGIQIEKNGRDFYNILTKQSDNPKAQSLFAFLSQEEEKHIKAFQEILQKTQRYEPQGLDSDDYYAYLNSLASEHVFTKAGKGEEMAKMAKTDEEGFDLAVGFEKESIIFYEAMKRVVPDFDLKILEELIAQEVNHLRKLTELRKSIK